MPAAGEEGASRGSHPRSRPGPPETTTGCTGYALARRIPARAREAALAPRTCRYRAHRLRLGVRTCSLIQGMGSMSQSSIELVLGHVAQPESLLVAGAVRLGDTSDVDGSADALSNPEIQISGFVGAEAR